MELNAFWAALLRRWYLTAGGVVLAIALTFVVVGRIGPTYKAEGSMLLFPPAATGPNGSVNLTQGNPYLNLGGLSQARDVVIRSLKSKSTMDDFARKEPRATYVVTPDYTTSGPILVLDVTSHSRDAATEGLKVLMATVPQTLISMQSGLDLKPAAYITSRTLTADRSPEVVRSGQVRSGIVVGTAVMAITLLLLALLDGILEARTSRKRPTKHRHDGDSRSVGPPLESNPAVRTRASSSVTPRRRRGARPEARDADRLTTAGK